MLPPQLIWPRSRPRRSVGPWRPSRLRNVSRAAVLAAAVWGGGEGRHEVADGVESLVVDGGLAQVAVQQGVAVAPCLVPQSGLPGVEAGFFPEPVEQSEQTDGAPCVPVVGGPTVAFWWVSGRSRLRARGVDTPSSASLMDGLRAVAVAAGVSGAELVQGAGGLVLVVFPGPARGGSGPRGCSGSPTAGPGCGTGSRRVRLRRGRTAGRPVPVGCARAARPGARCGPPAGRSRTWMWGAGSPCSAGRGPVAGPAGVGWGLLAQR